MEYLLVGFPQKRKVFVDGVERGWTNRVSLVEPGYHTVDLGDPGDYAPRSQGIYIGGTESTSPCIVRFSAEMKPQSRQELMSRVAVVVASIFGALAARGSA